MVSANSRGEVESAIEAVAKGRAWASEAVLRDSLMAICAARACEGVVPNGALSLTVVTTSTTAGQGEQEQEQEQGSNQCNISQDLTLLSKDYALLRLEELEGFLMRITELAPGAGISLVIAQEVPPTAKFPI